MDFVQDFYTVGIALGAHDGHRPAHQYPGITLQVDEISGLGVGGNLRGVEFHDKLGGRPGMLFQHPGLFGVNGVPRCRVFHVSPEPACSNTIRPATRV